MVNKMWRSVAFIGLQANDGESGHDVEGSIRLQGMVRRDSKVLPSIIMLRTLSHFFIQPQASR